MDTIASVDESLVYDFHVIFTMPKLKGFGNVANLSLAMHYDADLKKLCRKYLSGK